MRSLLSRNSALLSDFGPEHMVIGTIVVGVLPLLRAIASLSGIYFGLNFLLSYGRLGDGGRSSGRQRSSDGSGGRRELTLTGVIPLPPLLQREDCQILVGQVRDLGVVATHPLAEVFEVVDCRCHVGGYQ